MSKEEILKSIKEVQPIKGYNSMGVSESFYNPYYLISQCFSYEELETMAEKELHNMIKLAQFASDSFY